MIRRSTIRRLPLGCRLAFRRVPGLRDYLNFESPPQGGAPRGDSAAETMVLGSLVRRTPLTDVVYEDHWGQRYRD
jgi:hypothetical protein